MIDPKAQSTGGSTDAGTVQARLDRIRLEVSAQQARLARGSFLTAIIGVVLCGLMAVYFGYFYKIVGELLDPKYLADAAEDLLVRRLPEERRKLEPKIKESAPEWARSASTSFQQNLPDLRIRAEDLIMKQMDKGFDQIKILTADQFRKFVQQNRPMLADGFNSFQNPDKAERFLADLQTAVEKNMAADVRDQANEFLHVMIDLNRKLGKLEKGAGLNSEEALLREILMIAKRLEAEGGEEPPVKRKKAKPAAEPEEPKPEEPAAKPADEKEKAKKDTEPEKKSEEN